MIELSIIIPAYNAEDYIRANIVAVHDYLQPAGINFEIIVVDDGSSDRTSSEIKAAALERVRLITLPKNRGKFGALSAGMLTATGRARIFTDADIPFDFEALLYIHQLISQRNFHLVIGDRALVDSRYVTETSPIRRMATYLFSFFVRMVVTGGLFDTQCGLKGMRGDVAEALFPLVRTRGFAGDVELLYIALKYNLEIKRIPVRLRSTAPTTVRMVSHGLSMLSNCALLKFRWMKGWYRSPALTQIARQAYWQPEFLIEVSGAPGSARVGEAPSAHWRGRSSSQKEVAARRE